MNPLRLLAPGLLAAAPALAQCAFSTSTTTSVGPGCNPVVANATAPLAIAFSAPACQLDAGVAILLGASTGQPLLRAAVLGLQQTSTPLPMLGAGCVLGPSADVVLAQPWFGSGFTLTLPGGPLPPVSIFVQGAILYEGAGAIDWALSETARVDLQ